VEGVLGIKLLIFYSTADYSTADGWILNLFAGEYRVQCPLPNGIRYVSVASALRRSLTLVRVVFTMQVAWRSQNSMADSSTTTAPILDVVAGDCWARRQLPNGIRYVSVTSKLRNSLSSVDRFFTV